MTDDHKRELSIQRQLSALMERIIRIETMNKAVQIFIGTAAVIALPVLLEYYLMGRKPEPQPQEEQLGPHRLERIPFYPPETLHPYYRRYYQGLAKGLNEEESDPVE